MKGFKKILCYYRKSDGLTAFNRAVRLAKENNASLTIIEVIESLPKKYKQVKDRTLSRLYKDSLAGSKAHLNKLINNHLKNKLRIRAQVIEGKPFLEIIKKVVTEKYDLVIAAAPSGKRLKETQGGHIVLRLIRKCPCPVWVIKSKQTKTFNKIMAAVDPESDGNQSTNKLNHHIVDLAGALARTERSELIIGHCWDKYPELLLGFGYVDMPPKEINQILKESKQLHQEILEAFVQNSSIKNQPYKLKLTGGHAGEQIPKMARKENVDLIVMGTLSRTGISGMLLGNNAEKILDLVDCSLLTVKPEGFVTPVKFKK